MGVLGVVRLAARQVGYFDNLSRIHLTIKSPERTVLDTMNTTNLKRAVKTGTILLVSGSLELPEAEVFPVSAVKTAEAPEIKSEEAIAAPVDEIVEAPVVEVVAEELVAELEEAIAEEPPTEEEVIEEVEIEEVIEVEAAPVKAAPAKKAPGKRKTSKK